MLKKFLSHDLVKLMIIPLVVFSAIGIGSLLPSSSEAAPVPSSTSPKTNEPLKDAPINNAYRFIYKASVGTGEVSAITFIPEENRSMFCITSTNDNSGVRCYPRLPQSSGWQSEMKQ